MLEPARDGQGVDCFDSAAVETGPPDLVPFRPIDLVRSPIDLQAARSLKAGDEHRTAAAVQVAPLDPLSFVAAPLILLPTAVFASLMPALRAAAVDPARVLRQE